MGKIRQFLDWLTKSRYTRSLEMENERLREELRLWQNAMLESASLPRITPNNGTVKLPHLKRRMAPSQWLAEASRMTETKPEAKPSGN